MTLPPFILLASLLLDILAGDPPNRFHPVYLIGKCARHLERASRCIWGGSLMGGIVAALGTCVTALVVCTLFLLPFSLSTQSWLFWIPSILVIYMAPRGLAIHARRGGKALLNGDITSARKAVSMIVSRDTERMDYHGITRAAIESVAENQTNGVFSTLFWTTIACWLSGAWGAAYVALFHRIFNILDAMWGKKNDRYRYFETFAARMDDVLNFIPARLILPCISASAMLIKGTSSLKALNIGWRFRHAHASPNSAWSEVAFAGALNLRLEGSVTYKGLPADYPWMGIGIKEATAHDLNLSIRLMRITTLTGTLLFSLFLFIISIF